MPFKRPQGVPAKAPSAGDDPAAVPTRAPEGLSFPEGTSRVDLPEAPPFEHAGARVFAALPVDLDADGDGDLLLVSHPNPEGEDPTTTPRPAALETVERTAGGWAPAEALGALTDEHCALEAATLRPLGSRLALAALELSCLAEPIAPPAPPVDDAPPEPEGDETSPQEMPTKALREQRVLSLEARPRTLFRIGLESEGEGEGAKVQAQLASLDHDGDGHPDLQLDLEVASAPPVRLKIPLLNRPSGLARDSAEPEQTLLAIANEAKKARKRQPKNARIAAERVLAAHRALCRESGEARVHLDGVRGLPCGVSLAAGRAASVLAAVAAAQGKLAESLSLVTALEDGGRFRMTDNDRARIDYAFEALLEKHPIHWRRGPAVALAGAPPLRRPALAFSDAQHVLVRGPAPRSYDLGTGALSPIGMGGDLLLRQPDGAHVITDLFRSCEGYHLRVATASQVVAGVVTGAAAAEPRILAARPPAGSRCPEALSSQQARDRGGLNVLAWTRRGVLLQRLNTLLLLELDDALEPTGDARELSGRDAPRLQHSTALTVDGRWLAVAVKRGILVVDRERGTAQLRALPDAGAGSAPSDVAISPTGTQLALLQGGYLWIGGPQAARAEAPPAAVPAPPLVDAPPPAPPEPDVPDEG